MTIPNPCDMPYKVPRRRTFHVATNILFDGTEVRKVLFTRVKANSRREAWKLVGGGVKRRGRPYVIEVRV